MRATHIERTRALPGDELIPTPFGSLTHAVTIDCPPPQVWPWLAQMGAGSRAGWYSYDRLDNGGQASATEIVPSLQDVSVGTLFPAGPGVRDGFHLLTLEREHYLVLGWRPTEGAVPMVTWAFVLQKRHGNRTRLIVRVRGGLDYPFYGLPPWIGFPLVKAVHFVMQRKQLLGIASRAESTPHVAGRDHHVEAA